MRRCRGFNIELPITPNPSDVKVIKDNNVKFFPVDIPLAMVESVKNVRSQ